MSTPTSGSTSSTTPIIQSSVGDHPVSTGAKIGIGVGVSVAVLALLLVAWVLSRNIRSSAKDKQPESSSAGVPDTHVNNARAPGCQELQGKQMPAELDHRVPVEIDDHRR